MDITTKKIELHFIPPPVHSWQHAEFEKSGIKVDVLRLDRMHLVVGGNKWMKLKGFFEKALIENKAGILTFGGPWSNHIHACAWLCHQYGLRCHIRIKGNSRVKTAMLDDIVKWNAIIEFVNRAVFYKEEEAIRFATANNLLYIPMGGADTMGIIEITQFMQQLRLPMYDYAICGVGTATTFGGLAAVPNNFSNIIGIDAGTEDSAVLQKVQEWQQSLPGKTLSVVTGYDVGGFARYHSVLIHFMNELYNNNQIPTDIVYTGKVFYAVLNLAMKHYFLTGSKLLVLHSGGLQGNRSLPPGTLEF